MPHQLWALALWAAQQVPVPSPPSPLPPWIGAGGISGLFAWLWWTERSDRKEAERLTREVYKETNQRLTDGLVTIDRTLDVLDRAEKRGR